MIKIDDVKRRRKEIAEIRHADGVFRDIEARIKEREKYKLRWFWELLQNAKDSVDENNSVRAFVNYDNDHLIFSHTGEMFEMDDILSLIIQGSSKSEKKDMDGRFGTGFLTTYLLSKKVQISGKVIDDNKDTGYFQFWLDRTGETNKDFYISQTESNLAFDESIQDDSYFPGTDFQTQFIYPLDSEGGKTAEVGLQSLDELIPFTQLFNNKISSIVVERPGRIINYEKIKGEDIIIDKNQLTTFQLISKENDSPISSLKAYLLELENSEVCFMTTGVPVEAIKKLDNSYPKLYFTFPLIGTEDLGLPIVINSRKFDPKVERDGIYLLSDAKTTSEIPETENVNIAANKEIFSKSLLAALAVFTTYAAQNKIAGIYELFTFESATQYPWLDNDWLNKLKKEAMDAISVIACIASENNQQHVSLTSLTVPITSNGKNNNDLWDILNSLTGHNLPLRNELNNWVSVCENWAIINKVEIAEVLFTYEIDNLLSFFQECETIEKLTARLKAKPQEWLNKCYSLIEKEYESFPLRGKIMLNQHGEFRDTEGMFWDDMQDDILKEISAKIGLNFKKELISELINKFTIPSIKSLTKTIAIARLSTFFNTVSEDQYSKIELQEANALFLKWLIDNKELDIIKDLKILSGDKKREEDSLIVQAFVKGKHLSLPPLKFFEAEFPLYAGIIRERDCMHTTYTAYLTEKHYQYLNDNGLIHYSPLVIKCEKVDSKSLELLLVNPEDIVSLKDEDGKLKYEISFKYSDFAYLTSTEGHIYDRNSTPTSSLDRFRFLLLEATNKDPVFDEAPYEFVVEETGKKILFNRCLWLYRAKNLQWIYIKTIELGNDKKTSELPSSKNLSSLIKDSPELIKALKGDRQQLFLNRLGVGVSDLIRNTLPSDDLRSSWDKAITSLITSDANPELVQEIFNDAGIRKEYERRLRERKLISRNQHIGALVEALFKEVIEELKKNGININIKREPFGSDYLLTEESSDLVSANHQREGFMVDNWLVELKATGKLYAAMTPLQALTAKNEQHRYALVIVPLTGDDVDLAYVKLNARVISNIGSKIEKVIVDFNDVENKKAILNVGKEGVSVLIEDENVRFKISSDIWTKGVVYTIEQFIKQTFKTAN